MACRIYCCVMKPAAVKHRWCSAESSTHLARIAINPLSALLLTHWPALAALSLTHSPALAALAATDPRGADANSHVAAASAAARRAVHSSPPLQLCGASASSTACWIVLDSPHFAPFSLLSTPLLGSLSLPTTPTTTLLLFYLPALLLCLTGPTAIRGRR